MSHVRQQIREAVRDTLTGLPTCGSRVYLSRSVPVDDGAMPCMCVYVKSESSTAGTLRGRQNHADLVIDAWAAGATFDAVADLVQAEAEAALFGTSDAGRYLGGAVLDIEHTGCDSQYIGNAEKPYGVRREEYRVLYITEDGNAQEAK